MIRLGTILYYTCTHKSWILPVPESIAWTERFVNTLRCNNFVVHFYKICGKKEAEIRFKKERNMTEGNDTGLIR